MKKLFAPLCLSALALALSACDKSPAAETKAPWPRVRTEVIATVPLSINNELSGRVVARAWRKSVPRCGCGVQARVY